MFWEICWYLCVPSMFVPRRCFEWTNQPQSQCWISCLMKYTSDVAVFLNDRSDWKNAEAKWNHEKKERHQNYHTHINIQDKHALADFFVGMIRFNDYDECKRSAWYDHIIRLTYERRAHVSDSNFELKLTHIHRHFLNSHFQSIRKTCNKLVTLSMPTHVSGTRSNKRKKHAVSFIIISQMNRSTKSNMNY